MTQQTAAAPQVSSVDPLPSLFVWKAGKTYKTRGGSSVVVVTNSLRAPQPIGGILLRDHPGDDDQLFTWGIDGSYRVNGHESPLDLTTELA